MIEYHYFFQKYQEWRDGLPDLKWLDDVLPDNNQWQDWRGSLVEMKDNIKNNIEIGKPIFYISITSNNSE